VDQLPNTSPYSDIRLASDMYRDAVLIDQMAHSEQVFESELKSVKRRWSAAGKDIREALDKVVTGETGVFARQLNEAHLVHVSRILIILANERVRTLR